MLHASVHDAPTARRHRFARKRMKRVVDCLFTRQNPGAMSLSRPARARPICASAMASSGHSRPRQRDVSSNCRSRQSARTGESRPAAAGGFREFAALDLIVIDELGYLPFSQSGGHLLFHLISKLYENTSIIDHDQSRLRRLADRFRRRQDDHRVARPAHASLRHRRDRQRELALQEPLLTFKRPFLTPPRSPRLHNPDQFRRGERYPSCKPEGGSILDADRGSILRADVE